MPQLDVSTYTSQLFWLFIFWGILFVFLWKIVVPNFSHKLSERENKLNSMIEKAKILDQKADHLMVKYDQQLHELKTTQHERFQEVLKFIVKSKEDFTLVLEQNIQKIAKNYQKELDTSKHDILNDLPDRLIQSLMTFVKSYLNDNDIDQDDVYALLKEEIRKVPEDV